MTRGEAAVLSAAMDSGFVDSLNAFRSAPDDDPLLSERLAVALELGSLSDEFAGGTIPPWAEGHTGHNEGAS